MSDALNSMSEKLYQSYYLRVVSYLMSVGCDKNLAEELAQDTFVRAYSAKSAFRGESDAGTWLCAIAKNLFADEMRRRGRISELSEETDSGENLAADVANRDLSLRIHRILHGLKEPYREVFELRIFGELSFAEIGTVFGKTESWARVTYHRAKLQIQERMGQS